MCELGPRAAHLDRLILFFMSRSCVQELVVRQAVGRSCPRMSRRRRAPLYGVCTSRREQSHVECTLLFKMQQSNLICVRKLT